MKCIITLLLVCALSLGASAQGWQYDGNKGMLESTPLYLSGDVDAPTVLTVFAGRNNTGHELVLCSLFGECEISDFRESQQYVIFGYAEGQKKIPIKQVEVEGKSFQAFILKDPHKMIKLFSEIDWFTISLPLYRHGVQVFSFSADGYPLDVP